MGQHLDFPGLETPFGEADFVAPFCAFGDNLGEIVGGREVEGAVGKDDVGVFFGVFGCSVVRVRLEGCLILGLLM
jgi:hypothetical protein